MNDIAKIAKSMIKSVEDRLKILTKPKGERYESAPGVSVEDVKKLAVLKVEVGELLAKQEAKADEYRALREKIIAALPGNETDTVDVVIAGVRIHKYPRNSAAGKFDEGKVIELARKKRILRKITVLKRVIDKKALLHAIGEGKISYDEYMECTTPNITTVVEVEPTFNFDVKDEPKSKVEVV